MHVMPLNHLLGLPNHRGTGCQQLEPHAVAHHSGISGTHMSTDRNVSHILTRSKSNHYQTSNYDTYIISLQYILLMYTHVCYRTRYCNICNQWHLLDSHAIEDRFISYKSDQGTPEPGLHGIHYLAMAVFIMPLPIQSNRVFLTLFSLLGRLNKKHKNDLVVRTIFDMCKTCSKLWSRVWTLSSKLEVLTVPNNKHSNTIGLCRPKTAIIVIVFYGKSWGF